MKFSTALFLLLAGAATHSVHGANSGTLWSPSVWSGRQNEKFFIKNANGQCLQASHFNGSIGSQWYMVTAACDPSDGKQVFHGTPDNKVHADFGMCLYAGAADGDPHGYGNGFLVMLDCNTANQSSMTSWVENSDGLMKNSLHDTCAENDGSSYRNVQCSVTPNKVFYIEFIPTPSPTPPPTEPPTEAPTPTPITNAPTAALKASSSGDPHFRLWGGGKFDFHGGCDLVLLKNEAFLGGLGLRIHIRTKISTWWSFIESAVVQIGDETLEVTGGEGGGMHWLNGKSDDRKDGDTFSLANFTVSVRQVSSKQKRYRLDFGLAETAMSIETYKDFVSVNVKAGGEFEGALGLMGSYPSGNKVARDGSSLVDDVNEFGQEWQVLASEPMLFHELSGVQPPKQCAMPIKTTKSLRRRLGAVLLTDEEAALACSRVDEDRREACVFDVLATNDKGISDSY